jgi:hypothetical protein
MSFEKMYFLLKNWIALITPRFRRIHTRVYEYKIISILIPMCKSELIVLKSELFSNGLKAKYVGQLPLCISHTQLVILIGTIVPGMK